MGRMKQMLGAAPVGAMFNLYQEVDKALQVMKDSPTKWPTRSDEQDLKAMGYEETDMGFFFMLVRSHKPGRPAFKVYEGEERAATELLRKLNLKQHNADLWIASTGCTWDIAKQRYREAEVIECRAIVFSTPRQLMILSETP